jgi:hypothetical protein
MALYEREAFLSALPDEDLLSGPSMLMALSAPEAQLAQDGQEQGRLLEATFHHWNVLSYEIHQTPPNQISSRMAEWVDLAVTFQPDPETASELMTMQFNVSIIDDEQDGMGWQVTASDSGAVIGEGSQRASTQDDADTEGDSILHLDVLGERIGQVDARTWGVTYSVLDSGVKRLARRVSITEQEQVRWSLRDDTYLGWRGFVSVEEETAEAWVHLTHWSSGRAETQWDGNPDSDGVPDMVQCWDALGREQWFGVGEAVPDDGSIPECSSQKISF